MKRADDGQRPPPRRRAVLAVAALASAVAVWLPFAGCLGSMGAPARGILDVRVVDDADVPVEGARVTARGAPYFFGEVPTFLPEDGEDRTDADGWVHFGEVPAGTIVSVSNDGYLPAGGAVQVADGRRAVHVVRVAHGVRLRGRVIDSNGAAVGGASVTTLAVGPDAAGPTSLETRRAHTKTDPAGAFLTPATEPDARLRLSVSALGADRRTVAELLVTAGRPGVIDVGEIRVLDSVTTLRLDGEAVRTALRVDVSMIGRTPNGSALTYDIANLDFVPGGTVNVIGLPDGLLRWRLFESRLGPSPENEVQLGEGTSVVSGHRREVAIRRTDAAK